ncbi:MAG: helix-turn-helix domain-containing protein [Thioalkalispiraceae bacterium]|jgi:AraC-like DNA-binding protein
MLINISILTIGFSIISSAILFIAYLGFFSNVNKSWFAVVSCAGLLLCLAFLQLGHLRYLLHDTDVLLQPSYTTWLFFAPPLFFYFSRAVMLPEAKVSPLLLLHLLPPILLYYLVRYEIGISVMFLIGVGYSVWLANVIYGMRAQRQRFRYEMFFFALFSITAVFILILGISLPYMDHGVFYLFYTNSIGLAFVLIVAALLVFPDLLTDLAEAARLSYNASTLKGVDIDSSVVKLEQLMKEARLYQNENLNLAMLAEAVGLSSHQLSELINVHFGMGFSRYIREQRVLAAQTLLASEPESSILAISMECGFKSQSSFYAAFREMTGQSPGDYRKSLAG